MDKKTYRILGIVSFALGMLFFLNSQVNIAGAATGILGTSQANIFAGVLLFCISIGLFIIGGTGLEEKLDVKNTMVQKRQDGYHLYNTLNGEDYTAKELKEMVEDEGMKVELRKEYMSDLLRMYAGSTKAEKQACKSFIQALSPGSNPKNLEKRLVQFENIYNSIKDKAYAMNPGRVKDARDDDFTELEYVRFENERDTLWPDAGTIGFLPFDEAKVNPKRGPMLSVIPVARLVSDGYLMSDKTLNPSWSKQKRQDYLRDKHGVDVGARQRNIVFFQLEKGTDLQPYGNYQNISVGEKVPLVKVNKKK